MDYFKVKVAGNPEQLNVYNLNDWHIGHPDCDIDLIFRVVKEIEEDPLARANIVGDLVEFGTKKSIGSGVYDQVLNPQEQIDMAIEILEPIKDKIDVAVPGNHEERLKKDSGVDAMKVMSDKLGIRYMGYRGVVHYAWNKNSYPIMLWHGHGGGATNAYVERKLMSMTDVVDNCMAYVLGHYHKEVSLNRKRYRVDPFNNKVREDLVTFVCGNTALAPAGYAEMAGMQPGVTSQSKLILNGKRRQKDIAVEWVR